MSGYSPTWTNKGSDKLRALQTTKILMNALKRIISSFDITKKENEEVVVSTIAEVVFNFFTPHRDLSIDEQFDSLVEFLGWKTMNIEKKEESAIINLGANRFISSDSTDLSYLIIVSGIIRALGYFLFESDVKVEQIPSKFESQQMQFIIQKIERPIPSVGEKVIEAEASTTSYKPIVDLQQTIAQSSKPQLSTEEDEIRSSIGLNLEDVFSPILRNYPITMILPIFHQVLAEISTTFFSDMEDANVKKAKGEFNENHTQYLIEILLTNIRDADQNMHEISSMIGQYVIKTIKTSASEDLLNYLPDDITSTVSRRVAYVEFPARSYCTYAPGEKCVEGKRDLCEFVLYMWEGMLQNLLPDKTFTVGERIPATRRGKFCLVEFLKGE
ncbi:MAG: hypothetical protein KGD64_01155 [Candidatus Heimdallarchaeota archaeon]|nr:hypothetical protein [Candidatus Heimdallarchaeota archaeon]